MSLNFMYKMILQHLLRYFANGKAVQMLGLEKSFTENLAFGNGLTGELSGHGIGFTELAPGPRKYDKDK